MAGTERYRPNVDYTVATSTTIDGHKCFTPDVNANVTITSADVTIAGPLGSRSAATSVSTTASTEDVARTGIITETAPATDTASSGLNGRLQRIAQRLTSLIALFPTALGSTAAASSLAVTASTEDVARVGIVTETAPATDTASSGLNGRLQRIAQRLTSLIALFPVSLGAKATTGSLSCANSFLTVSTGGDGSVGNSAETITVANTVQLVEFFNLSANPIWASWTGTAAASTAGSFPIPPLASNVAGFYSAPPGASGSLSIIAPAGASAFTCNLWS